MLSLIDEVLETSRINAGKAVTVSAAARETQVIEEVNSIISQKASEAGLLYRAKIKDCDDRYVMMDTEYVERILINLLSNAIKFSQTRRHGRFCHQSLVQKRKVPAMSIPSRTTGSGSASSSARRCSLPFERENSDEIGLRNGQGLGPYICKNLVDLMQGTINCESVKDKGTTFTVILEYDLASEEQIRLQRRKKSHL